MTINHSLQDSDDYQASANGSAREISIIPLPRREAKAQPERKPVELQGKVALIIGGATDKVQSLAVAFAERGINLALVYFNQDHGRAAQIKREVEQRDQQCMLIPGYDPEKGEDRQFAEAVVLQLLQRFGRLDIFINLSARTFPLGEIVGSGEEQLDALRARIFPQFGLMRAALEQIAR
jgi:NAD(P)-dependent dehydrogenase (short-subunit alcohol dehydrogenase family)